MKNEKKIIFFSLIVFIGIIILEIFINIYLKKTSSILISQIEKAKQYVENEQWNNAKSIIYDTCDRWNNIEEKWALITNHHEIDNITVSLKSAKEFIDSAEKPDALSSLENLKHFISHIPKMEKLLLENIF
ncbi:protein of unknown function [Caloramator quimbayensis]|uniref:DUF4363 domain-containing protein n=1 Tax=Caloramator quimbayensis TaxID=1147123 RepID=A0A1T4X892_9CLOT|nr:DUF4363 family protein [Caloramator quimbayensis]SKA85318.1 protein of unknown function [Caloramator quimbayensis]